jgi:hypothetical protein
MAELISQTPRRARKVHIDSCKEWIENSDFTGMLTFSERRAIIEARRRNWKILPGMVYCHQVNKQDGEIFDFRSMPELIEICQRADVWSCI